MSRAAKQIEWRRHPVNYVLTVLVVGVAMWFVFGAWVSSWLRQPNVARQPVDEGEPAGDLTVAKVIRTDGAVWNESGADMHDGIFLLPGQRLDLAAGLAQIEFDRGATMILEGPAVFVVAPDGSDTFVAGGGFLEQGRLTANVPAAAHGFAVHTATAAVVDLGTQFGVAVSEQEVTDIVVFQGSVKVDAGTANKHLVTGETAQAKFVDGKVVFSTGSPQVAFVRTMPPPLVPRDVLAIDFNARKAAGPPATADGFGEFLLGDTGARISRTFGEIDVTLIPGNRSGLDDRRREKPVERLHFTDSALLRDFVFGPNWPGETLEVRIEGLTPGGMYEVTLWSFDSATKGTGLASRWSVGERIVRNNHQNDGRVLPISNRQYRFSFLANADEAGVLTITGEHVSPADRYTVFLNALRIRELVRAPAEPAEEATQST